MAGISFSSCDAGVIADDAFTSSQKSSILRLAIDRGE